MKRFRRETCRTVGAIAAFVATVLLGVARLAAEDWPHWRGPNWDGTTPEKVGTPDLARADILWRAKVGKGWSSVAVVKDRCYTMGNADDRDTLFCLDATSGKVLWDKSYDCPDGNYPGPRATPTVDAGRVYVLSRQGDLRCYDAITGDEKWAVKIAARPPSWGFTGSVRVFGKHILVNVGGQGLAFDKESGREVWGSTDGKSGYATPVVWQRSGQARVLVFSAKGLIAVRADNGRPLWSFGWETKYDVNAADPIVLPDGNIFISSGYDRGCTLLTPDGKRVWENTNMRNHFNTCVLKDGFLYGIDENQLRCLDAKTGEVKWTEESPRKGGLILADDTLVILGERGELILAKATPESFRAITRGPVIRGLCWTPPTLSGGRVFCRTSSGDVACVSVK